MAPSSKTVKVKVIPIVYMASRIWPLVSPLTFFLTSLPVTCPTSTRASWLPVPDRFPASPAVPPPLPTSGLCSLVGFEVASYLVTQGEIGPCSHYSCPLSLL